MFLGSLTMCPFPIIPLICSMLAPTLCQKLSSSYPLQLLAFSHSVDFVEHCALGPFGVETWGNAKALTYSLGPKSFVLFSTKSGGAEKPTHCFLLSLLCPTTGISQEKGFNVTPSSESVAQYCREDVPGRAQLLAVWPSSMTPSHLGESEHRDFHSMA